MPFSCERPTFWRPSASKFSAARKRSKAALRAGHSPSSIENQAESRFFPLTIMCWRKRPSKEKPKRRAAARRLVVVVAFPFEAAIAEIVEDVLCLQIDRLGCERRLLQGGREEDVAGLDATVRHVDAHQGHAAERSAALLIDDRVIERVREGWRSRSQARNEASSAQGP